MTGKAFVKFKNGDQHKGEYDHSVVRKKNNRFCREEKKEIKRKERKKE